MKTIGNQGFLTISNATGRIVSVKTPSAFQIANKINGFEQISCGTALKPNQTKLLQENRQQTEAIDKRTKDDRK
jgi:hypothetical protein